MSITHTLEALDALIAEVGAGYGPFDETGEIEAEVLAEVTASEYRTTASEVFAGIARRPGTVDLSAHDLSGITLVFGDLSACD